MTPTKGLTRSQRASIFGGTECSPEPRLRSLPVSLFRSARSGVKQSTLIELLFHNSAKRAEQNEGIVPFILSRALSKMPFQGGFEDAER